MKLLFLTDHRHHKTFDSVYLLSKWVHEIEGLIEDLEVYVASFGCMQNAAKLGQPRFNTIHAVRAQPGLTYAQRATCFSSHSTELSTDEIDWVCLRVLPISITALTAIGASLPNAQFINHPRSILTTESKAYLLKVPQLCPPMQMCSGVEDVLEFLNQGSAVLKPLFGYGGNANLLLDQDRCFHGTERFERSNLATVLAQIYEANQPYLAMQYLPDYHKGDKRILVFNGAIVGASLRIPNGHWLCNVSAGGQVTKTSVTEFEKQAVATLAPRLAREGVNMFGIDTLQTPTGGRAVTEINTCCPGGFYSIHTVLGDREIQRKSQFAFQQLLEAA